jgi:hypothetical protein
MLMVHLITIRHWGEAMSVMGAFVRHAQLVMDMFVKLALMSEAVAIA